MDFSEENLFIPQLDQCFSGKAHIWSWEDVWYALTTSKETLSQGQLNDCFQDMHVQRYITQIHNLHPGPDADEARTLVKVFDDLKKKPIGEQTSSVNLDELKVDTQWLSNEVDIGIEYALKLVMLDWQNQPRSRLFSKFSGEERLAIQEVVGSTSAVIWPVLEPQGDSEDVNRTEKQRRHDLLLLYTTESRFLSSVNYALMMMGMLDQNQHLAKLFVGDLMDSMDIAIIGTSNIIYAHFRDNNFSAAAEAGFQRGLIDTARSRLELFAKDEAWKEQYDKDGELDSSWRRLQLAHTRTQIQVALAVGLFSQSIASVETVKLWFTLMSDFGFFGSSLIESTDPLVIEMASQLEIMASIYSFTILSCSDIRSIVASTPIMPVTYKSGEKEEETEYIYNEETILLIQETLLSAIKSSQNSCCFSLLAWGLIGATIRDLSAEQRALSSRTISGAGEYSTSEMKWDNFAELLTTKDPMFEVTDGDQVAIFLAMAVDNFRVIEMIPQVSKSLEGVFPHFLSMPVVLAIRMTFMNLLRESLGLLDYSPELVHTIVSVIGGGRSFKSLLNQPGQSADIVAKHFLGDNEVFVGNILRQAQMRFPLETSPLLSIISTLGLGLLQNEQDLPQAIQMLGDMESFTQLVPREFNGYEIIRDGKSHIMSLARPLWIFSSHQAWARMDYEEDGHMEIPEGVKGEILTTAAPHITCWKYSYNGYQFLASCLDSFTSSSSFQFIATPGGISAEVAADIISSITDLLASTINQKPDGQGFDNSDSIYVLSHCCSILPRERQISSIVFEILEEHLGHVYLQDRSASAVLVTKCVQFLEVLARIYPGRVWGPLSRSKLLDLEGSSGSALTAIVTSREMVTGSYPFLKACIALLHVLIDDAITNAVRRKTLAPRAGARFSSNGGDDPIPSDRTIEDVLLGFVKVMSGSFESYGTWRFQDPMEKLEIGTALMDVFSLVLANCCIIDDEKDTSERILFVFQKAANFLADSFLSETPENLLPKSLLFTIVSSVPALSSTLKELEKATWRKYVSSFLELSITLLRVQSFTGRSQTWLERRLFLLAPIFVRTFASRLDVEAKSATVLQVMMETTVKNSASPESLIGNMGQGTVRDFLTILTQTPILNRTEENEIRVWKLLRSAASSRQQSFALAIVTGWTPRMTDYRQKDAQKDKRDNTKSVFSVTLNKLVDLSTLPSRRAVWMVKFVNACMNYWQAAVTEFSKNADVFQEMLSFLSNVVSLPETEDIRSVEATVYRCLDRQIAAYISQMLAILLHYERQIGRPSSLSLVVRIIDFFEKEGSLSPPYNRSLHANLAKNFSSKFAPYHSHQLKRSSFEETELGVNFYYDIDLASKLFSYDKSWKGLDRRSKNGMKAEFTRANLNLSIVEAQVQLLNGWELLAIELSHLLDRSTELAKVLHRVVAERLQTSQTAFVQQPVLMENIALESLRLSFTIMQQIIRYNQPKEGVSSLLKPVWNALVTSDLDFTSAYSQPPSRIEYHRTLLKMLFLSLQAYTPQGAGESKRIVPSYLFELYLEILDRVVLTGFMAFVNELHANPKTSDPADLVLIISTLQTLLRIPAVQLSYPQISLRVSNAETVRYAVTLYSWSDRLTGPDPIYAELSSLFLLTLSSVPPIAESMAVDGLLDQLSACSIAHHFRKGNGVGPVDKQWRMHALWSQCILPLCLNLLDSVGPSFAAEVSTFLNQYPGQLSRNVDTVSSVRSSIVQSRPAELTAGVARETHALAMLAMLIESYRAGGASVGVVAADIPALEWDRAGLADDLKTWIQGGRLRRERLVLVSDKDVRWMKQPGKRKAMLYPPHEPLVSPPESLLEERIMDELEGALLCLEQCPAEG